MAKTSFSTLVRDTAAGQSIAAWAVLRSDGTHVANVHAHYGKSGCVRVDVWDVVTFGPVQSSRASGYGYDKLTAALAGMVIDGHRLTDHASRDGAPSGPFGPEAKAPLGYVLANPIVVDGTFKGWRDCYRWSGLDYLNALGYVVIKVI